MPLHIYSGPFVGAMPSYCILPLLGPLVHIFLDNPKSFKRLANFVSVHSSSPHSEPMPCTRR